MSSRNVWTRQDLLMAFSLYYQLPFGKMHSRNPEIIRVSKKINRTPSALAMKLTNIASLDPIITLTGRKGLTGASKKDKAMWEEMQEDWELFAVEMQKATSEYGLDSPASEFSNDLIIDDVSIDFTGKNKVVKSFARVGQNFFRRAVLSSYNYKCCITGLAVPELLIASHIVPWRKDEKNRLNPQNGLSLAPLHDKAFDIGIITVTLNMTMQVSKKYIATSDSYFLSSLLAFDGKEIALPDKFIPKEDFLLYHHNNVFIRE